MTEKMIIDAYCRVRTIDNTIPDEVLDFMKDASIEKLRQINKNRELLNQNFDNDDEDFYDDYYECPSCGFNPKEDSNHSIDCPDNDEPFALLMREGFD
jgi:hypothetical protein